MLIIGVIIIIGLVGTGILRYRYHYRLAMGPITEAAFACALLNIGIFLFCVLLGQLSGPNYLPLYRLLQGGLMPLIGISVALVGMVRERGLMNWWLLWFNVLFLIFDLLLVWSGH